MRHVEAFVQALAGSLLALLGLVALGVSISAANACGVVLGLGLLLIGGSLVAVSGQPRLQPRGARARISADTGADLSVTALELIRRRLRGSTGPGRTADEQVVRGRLRGLPVSVRARLGLDELRPREATCRVEAPVEPSLVGTTRGEVRLVAGGLELVLSDPGAVDLLDALEDLVAHAEAMRAEASRAVAPHVVRRPARDATAPRCPYCHTPADEDVVVCERCETPQHEACFAEHGRCSVHACDGVRARPRRERA